MSKNNTKFTGLLESKDFLTDKEASFMLSTEKDDSLFQAPQGYFKYLEVNKTDDEVSFYICLTNLNDPVDKHLIKKFDNAFSRIQSINLETPSTKITLNKGDWIGIDAVEGKIVYFEIASRRFILETEDNTYHIFHLYKLNAFVCFKQQVSINSFNSLAGTEITMGDLVNVFRSGKPRNGRIKCINQEGVAVITTPRHPDYIPDALPDAHLNTIMAVDDQMTDEKRECFAHLFEEVA